MIRESTRLSRNIDAVISYVAKAPVRISLAAILACMLLGGAAFSIFESEASYWDGIYWSVVVMTTVGFGDFSPESLPGRAVFYLIVPAGLLATMIIGGAFTAAIVVRRVEAHEDTPELDDDFDHLLAKLEEMMHEARRIKDIAAHPRVRQALAEVHAETPSRGGR